MRQSNVFRATCIIFLASFAVHAESAPPTVRGAMGNVTVVREGISRQAAIGDTIRDGDVIRVPENSYLELNAANGALVTVRGPKTFRADMAQLQVRMRSGGALYGLYRHFSRSVQHRPSMTIVASVRSREAAAEGRKVRAEFENAIALFDAGKDDDAALSFSSIERSPYLTAASREQIRYYGAEILLRRGMFAEALVSFEALSLSIIADFPFKEESHARAVLCAEHAGLYARMDELAKDYLARYGERGKFVREMRELVGGEK